MGGLAAGLALAAAGACRAGEAPPPAGPAARRYEVRAEVVAVPPPRAGARQLTVRHEAVPSFVDRSGAPVGMPSMVMTLDLGPDASAEGLRAGDPVALRLVVDWTRPLLQIERVERLPAGTKLRLEAAPPHPSR